MLCNGTSTNLLNHSSTPIRHSTRLAEKGSIQCQPLPNSRQGPPRNATSIPIQYATPAPSSVPKRAGVIHTCPPAAAEDKEKRTKKYTTKNAKKTNFDKECDSCENTSESICNLPTIVEEKTPAPGRRKRKHSQITNLAANNENLRSKRTNSTGSDGNKDTIEDLSVESKPAAPIIEPPSACKKHDIPFGVKSSPDVTNSMAHHHICEGLQNPATPCLLPGQTPSKPCDQQVAQDVSFNNNNKNVNIVSDARRPIEGSAPEVAHVSTTVQNPPPSIQMPPRQVLPPRPGASTCSKGGEFATPQHVHHPIGAGSRSSMNKGQTDASFKLKSDAKCPPKLLTYEIGTSPGYPKVCASTSQVKTYREMGTTPSHPKVIEKKNAKESTLTQECSVSTANTPMVVQHQEISVTDLEPSAIPESNGLIELPFLNSPGPSLPPVEDPNCADIPPPSSLNTIKRHKESLKRKCLFAEEISAMKPELINEKINKLNLEGSKPSEEIRIAASPTLPLAEQGSSALNKEAKESGEEAKESSKEVQEIIENNKADRDIEISSDTSHEIKVSEKKVNEDAKNDTPLVKTNKETGECTPAPPKGSKQLFVKTITDSGTVRRFVAKMGPNGLLELQTRSGEDSSKASVEEKTNEVLAKETTEVLSPHKQLQEPVEDGCATNNMTSVSKEKTVTVSSTLEMQDIVNENHVTNSAESLLAVAQESQSPTFGSDNVKNPLICVEETIKQTTETQLVVVAREAARRRKIKSKSLPPQKRVTFAIDDEMHMEVVNEERCQIDETEIIQSKTIDVEMQDTVETDESLKSLEKSFECSRQHFSCTRKNVCNISKEADKVNEGGMVIEASDVVPNEVIPEPVKEQQINSIDPAQKDGVEAEGVGEVDASNTTSTETECKHVPQGHEAQLKNVTSIANSQHNQILHSRDAAQKRLETIVTQEKTQMIDRYLINQKEANSVEYLSSIIERQKDIYSTIINAEVKFLEGLLQQRSVWMLVSEELQAVEDKQLKVLECQLIENRNRLTCLKEENDLIQTKAQALGVTLPTTNEKENLEDKSQLTDQSACNSKITSELLQEWEKEFRNKIQQIRVQSFILDNKANMMLMMQQYSSDAASSPETQKRLSIGTPFSTVDEITQTPRALLRELRSVCQAAKQFTPTPKPVNGLRRGYR